MSLSFAKMKMIYALMFSLLLFISTAYATSFSKPYAEDLTLNRIGDKLNVTWYQGNKYFTIRGYFHYQGQVYTFAQASLYGVTYDTWLVHNTATKAKWGGSVNMDLAPQAVKTNGYYVVFELVDTNADYKKHQEGLILDDYIILNWRDLENPNNQFQIHNKSIIYLTDGGEKFHGSIVYDPDVEIKNVTVGNFNDTQHDGSGVILSKNQTEYFTSNDYDSTKFIDWQGDGNDITFTGNKLRIEGDGQYIPKNSDLFYPNNNVSNFNSSHWYFKFNVTRYSFEGGTCEPVVNIRRNLSVTGNSNNAKGDYRCKLENNSGVWDLRCDERFVGWRNCPDSTVSHDITKDLTVVVHRFDQGLNYTVAYDDSFSDGWMECDTSNAQYEQQPELMVFAGVSAENCGWEYDNLEFCHPNDWDESSMSCKYLKSGTYSGETVWSNNTNRVNITAFISKESDSNLSAQVMFKNFSWIDGLISYWDFDELNTDDLMGNHHLTSTGSPRINTTVGKFYASAEFDCNMCYYRTPNIDEIENVTEFTISAWVQASELDNAAARTIMRQSVNVGNQAFILSWQITEDIILYVYNESGDLFSAVYTDGIPTNRNVNTWYHVLGMYNGTHVSVYVNGTKGGTTSEMSSPVQNSEAIFTISHPIKWVGKIDEVMVWNRSLSEDEITELYEWTSWQFTDFQDFSDGDNNKEYTVEDNIEFTKANFKLDSLQNTTSRLIDYNLSFFNVTVAEADTCTYSSGNWEIDCADNCNIVSTDVGGNVVYISGTGSVYGIMNITNATKIEIKPGSSCKAYNIK